jgi:hypothetical protein
VRLVLNACRIAALAFAALATACSSVPLSTIARGATFNESNFGFLDARALRVKVSLPEGFVLDPGTTRLTALVSAPAGPRILDLVLRPLTTTSGTRVSGMWSREIAVTSFEMDLTDESAAGLRALQGLIANKKVTSVHLDVHVTLKTVPAGATSAKVWVELMLSPIEGYFPLIDGGTIPLGNAATS